MDLAERAEKDKQEMFDCLDSADIDKLKSDGLTIRVGEKMLKLSLEREVSIPGIDELKKEFRDRLNTQQTAIKAKINQKIQEITEYHHQLKLEYKRKERELKEILAKSAPMPDVYEKHAKKGLSVVKGHRKGELIWLVHGVYWPKTYDQVKIEPKFSKKMISPVIFEIHTTEDNVTNVSTRKPIGLDYFSHYHQSRPDCWGSWKYPHRYSSPDDIINIARQAEAVLENIHSGSIAEANPRGLPRQNTVKRHLLAKEKTQEMGSLNQSARRAGISEDIRSTDDSVWSL